MFHLNGLAGQVGEERSGKGTTPLPDEGVVGMGLDSILAPAVQPCVFQRHGHVLGQSEEKEDHRCHCGMTPSYRAAERQDQPAQGDGHHGQWNAERGAERDLLYPSFRCALCYPGPPARSRDEDPPCRQAPEMGQDASESL